MMVEFGINMLKETIGRIETAKDYYITRGKYGLKAVHRLLKEEEQQQQEMLQDTCIKK